MLIHIPFFMFIFPQLLHQTQERARQCFVRDYGRRFPNLQQLEMSFNLKLVSRQAVTLQPTRPDQDSVALLSGSCSVVVPALLRDVERQELGDVYGKASSPKRNNYFMPNSGFGGGAAAAGGRAVQAKLCSPADNESSIALMVEARLLHALSRHPHIVDFVGLVAVGDPLMLLTPVMPGGTLADYLKQQSQTRTLRLSDHVAMCAHVASAMAYLESLAIVHRNLSTRAVFVGNGPMDLKLAGFGALVGGAGRWSSVDFLVSFSSCLRP